MMKRGAVPTVLLLDPASFGGTGDVSETAELLATQGVTHYVITPDVLNSSEVQPAWQQTWGWEILDSGHVVPASQPQDVTWRVLA
jgi:hypothetical protein